MQVNVERPSQILIELHVSLEKDEIRQAHQDAVRKIKAKAKVPGFRPGKVPDALIRKRFGPLIEAEGVDQILQSYVPKAVQESDTRPVSVPRVKEATEQLNPEGEFTFVVECDVLPSLDKIDYKGISIPKTEINISDDDVLSEVTQIQKRHADAIPVTDKPAEIGNKVEFSYFGNAGETAIPEDDAISNEATLGEETLVPGLQDALVGLEIGASAPVAFTYPDDFPSEELRGLEASFTVTLKAIHEIQYPDIDDELAKSVGLESLDELKSKIRDNILHEKEHEARDARQNELFDALVEKNAFEVPERMVHEAVHTMQNLYHRSLVGQGLQPEAASQLIENSSANAQPMAERQIKIDHLLTKIQELETIEVSDEDLEEAMQHEAAHTGMPLPRIKARYGSDDLKNRLSSRVLRDKTISFLLGDATEPHDHGAASDEDVKASKPEATTLEDDKSTDANDAPAEDAGPQEENNE